jgi:hypothetical protein
MEQPARIITSDQTLDIITKCANDPWEYLHYVFTRDEVDPLTPIKLFPVHLDYLKLLTRLWQKKRLLAIPKSRRMRISWTMLSLYSWKGLFQLNRHIAMVSKKEDDADELIKRIKFIIENLDSRIPAEFRKFEYRFNNLYFPETGSRIQGFPQGADQLRQYTFSDVFGDECAFWEDAEKMYSASFPTIEGGGGMCLVSSPAPGFFKKLVFDKLDEMDLDEILNNAQIKYPMQGVEVWENLKNKFTVMQLHYSADPAKRTPLFKETIKGSMPIRQYQMEYELNWESWEGLPVYPDWDLTQHGSKEEIKPILGLPLLRGWDFGLTPACIVCQLQGSTLVCLKEFTAVNMGAERFSDIVLRECRILYPGWTDFKKQWRDFIDPSGTFRKDTDETTCAGILQEKGLQTIPGAITWEERRTSVEHFLTVFTKEGPNLKVVLGECNMLVKGFNGGYRYDSRTLEIEPAKLRPIKNEFSHIQDALQMVTSMLTKMKPTTGRRVPLPEYGQSRMN